MGRILFGGTAALLICMFLSPKFIEFLRASEFGQQIREDGPEGHQQKAGTPTMGGVIIFIAISVPFLILTDYDWRSVGIFGAMIACALLGFADDYTKLVKRRSLGLRARTKLIVTIAISLGLWYIARYQAHLAPTLRLRFVDYQIDLGWALSAADLLRRRRHDERRQPDRRARRARGRLRGDRAARVHRHHVHHRRVRPGDARRLPRRRLHRLPLVQRVPGDDLHGRYGLARARRRDRRARGDDEDGAAAVLLGGIFVIEALSVAIQVISFQTTRKRVFLMAPIHHHFELKAWSETKIILRFWIVAAICCAIGFTIYRQSIG